MPLQNLSQMKDEDYKKLSPEELMKYNRPMPEFNYDKPYSHQEHPRMMFRPRTDGTKRLQSMIAEDAKQQAALEKEGWKKSPADFGVITAPPAKKELDTSSDIPMEPDAA